VHANDVADGERRVEIRERPAVVARCLTILVNFTILKNFRRISPFCSSGTPDATRASFGHHNTL